MSLIRQMRAMATPIRHAAAAKDMPQPHYAEEIISLPLPLRFAITS